MTPCKARHLLILTVLLFVLALPASAQSIISEIMYAPNDGVAHEWFEIFNSGSSDVNMADFKFNDGSSSNHDFEEPPKNGGQGSLVIPSGTYAIVAKEADTFLSAHSGFSGTVIDGSLSLKDTGDELSIIKNDDGEVIDIVSYYGDAGARKNGLSLQLIDGNWSAGTPTPGSGSLSVSQPASQPASQEQEENQTASNNQSNSSASGTSSFTVEPQIFVSAGKDRVVTVGADTLFKGEAVGIIGKPLTGARFVWNFGDGMRKEGPNILHYYRYPGEYVVTLEVSSGEYTASDRIKVSVNEAKVAITRGTPDVITIANLDEYELDLSWWFVSLSDITLKTSAFISPFI